MPTVEIDGKKIQVEDGLTVIQAADRVGVEIPHYCWHPGLSISGNCRMCLVEIEKSPKLQIACNTRVTEGMVVHTTSDKTKTAQKAVLEFLLLNHPIDCPRVRSGRECKLQEYRGLRRQRSRMPLDEKVHKGKAIQIGQHVMLDQERCILCARCTRFCDEITKTSELGIFERGDQSRIELAPGKTLDNPYSMNVIDICPVGAERSVCGACANGATSNVPSRAGSSSSSRARTDVNGFWMCDAGRLSWGALQGEGGCSGSDHSDAAFAPASGRAPSRWRASACRGWRARTGQEPSVSSCRRARRTRKSSRRAGWAPRSARRWPASRGRRPLRSPTTS
jgi:NADH-quinone oxidoreductase subunit G